jgi:hypothetical protein
MLCVHHQVVYNVTILAGADTARDLSVTLAWTDPPR